MNHSGHCKLWWLLAQLTAPDAARPDILQTLASELTNCGRKMKQALVAFAFNSVFFQSILRFRVCVAGEANFETPKNQFHLRTDEISNPKQLPSDDARAFLAKKGADRSRKIRRVYQRQPIFHQASVGHECQVVLAQFMVAVVQLVPAGSHGRDWLGC